MRNSLLLSLIFFFGALSAADECDVPTKVKDIAAFYKLLDTEASKTCGNENCEIKLSKINKEVLAGDRCDRFCNAYNEHGFDKMMQECEKVFSAFTTWIKKNFKDDDKLFYASIRLAPGSPCSMVLDGPYRKLYYLPRTGEVFIEGDGKCPWGCGKQKPKETK